MAIKKPLVMGTSGPEVLQTGDSIQVDVAKVDVEPLTNGGGSAAVIGTPVYISASNTFQAARANALATREVHGLVYDVSIAAAASGSVATDGVMTATTTQWDAVTGQTGGLTAGSVYYLDAAAAGKLTTTAPTANPNHYVRVGKAISSTDMSINIEPGIAL